ncbi:MAG: ABC transporter ATP-binding protein [Burkholderiaceae bacterium]
MTQATNHPQPPDLNQASLIGMVFSYIRRNANAYALAAILLVGVALVTAWVPRKVGQTVDAFVAGDLSGGDLLAPVALLLAAGIAIYLMRVTWRIKLYGTAYWLGVSLREALYRTLAGHGPAFFQQRRTGRLMALATNDIDAIEMAAGEAFLAGFDGTLTLIVVIAMMSLGIDWRLTLIALMPFPLMALSFWWISRQVHHASRAQLEAFSKLNEQTQQTIAGVHTVRAIGLEQQTHQAFSDLTASAADAGFQELKWESAFEPAVGLTLGSAIVLVFAVGGSFLLAGELTIGELTAFTMYMGQLIWPMFAMGWVLSLIERGRAAWLRLAPVLTSPPDIDDSGSVETVPNAPLQIKHASLTYPGQTQPALQDIDLCVEPGKTIGIVGPTGAGKSSLASLVLRHYQPASGTITWGNTSIKAFTLDALRAATAWVPQEAFLFSSTLSENIALADPTASVQAIEQVARLAALHQDIAEFPAGYDTLVGERGVTLSGGQRQRVAIARALLANAPLLILDDALSAVDTETEASILGHLRALREQQPGRSTIIISHRLSAVLDADEIVVLQSGRITARGSHTELVAESGWYARQWQYQQLEASLDED